MVYVQTILLGMILILGAASAFAHEADLSASAEPDTTTGKQLTLSEVIERTLAYSPEMKRVDAQLADRLAEAFETRTLSNPEAEFDNSFVDGGTPAMDASLEQPLRLSDFGSRSSYADALKRVGNLEKKVELLRLINAATELYYDYWLLQEQERYLRASEKQVREVVHQVKHASERGEVAAADTGVFNAEALRLTEELRNVRTRRNALKEPLLKMLNLPWQEHITLAKPALVPVPEQPERLLAFARENDMIRSVLTARKDAAEARYNVARQDAIMPELAPRFLYERNPDGREEGVGVGIRLSIPLWNRNEGEMQRAKSRLSLAQTELAVFDHVNLENVIKARHSQAYDSQTRANNYRDKILPSYEKSYGLTKQMFNAGQASILDLWQVRERINDIQENTLEALADSIKARLALEEAIGGKLEEIQ